MTAIPEIIPADAAARRRITVLGAGAWGTAVAMALAARHDVLLWGRNAEAMAATAASGEMAWTEAKGLSAKRNVVARAGNLKVRASPDDNSSAVLLVDKGVLLEMSEQPNGNWLKVRHKDGQVGYVKTSEVWGL